jgi:L-asparaginase
MIFSENRFTLFGIMPWRKPTAVPGAKPAWCEGAASSANDPDPLPLQIATEAGYDPMIRAPGRDRMRDVVFGIAILAAAAWPRTAEAQTSQPALARVHVMTGPGTLPRNPKNRLEFLRYATTGEKPLSAQELVERIPELAQFARVTADDGPAMPFDQPQQLKELSLKMSALLADPDLAGIVFAHGTNTIEETAYFLNLTVKSEKPIVIVGAQRPFSTLSSDAALNLLNAIRVAADPGSRGKGTLVVLNDTVQAARDVTKSNTYRVETFQSREVGILGYADPDRVVYYRAPVRKHTIQSEFDVAQISSFPKVSILYSYSGDDGDLARAAVAAGAKGLVIAGTGAGHTNNARKILKELHESTGVIVVRSARVGAGRVVREDNWQEPGFVAADNLNPQKARILLQLGLTKTSKPDEIQRMFDEY